MAYCSIEDITSRMPEPVVKKLTQDDKVSNEVNQTVVSSAIFDATAIIDSKLFQVYTLPISPTPGILLRIAVDLAIYFIYRNRFDNKVPEEVKASYDEAIKQLDKIKSGEELLPGVTKAPSSTFIIKTNMTKEDIYFNKDRMKTFL